MPAAGMSLVVGNFDGEVAELLEATATHGTNTHVDGEMEHYLNSGIDEAIVQLEEIGSLTAGVMLPATTVTVPPLGPLTRFSSTVLLVSHFFSVCATADC